MNPKPSKRQRFKNFILRRKLNTLGLLVITLMSGLITIACAVRGFSHTDISRKKLSICARRFPKGDAPNGRRKRSESPLVGRWGKAPYPKMLRYLFLEMFG